MDYVRDRRWLPGGISQSTRRRPVVPVVAQHELSPAPLDHMPRAGVEHRLELIEAGGRGGPVAVAIQASPPRAHSHKPSRSRAASATRLTARPGIVMKNTTATPG